MAIAPAGRTLLPVAVDLDFDFGIPGEQAFEARKDSGPLLGGL